MKKYDALSREFYGCDVTAIKRKLTEDLNELEIKYYKFKVSRITLSKHLYEEWKNSLWLVPPEIYFGNVGIEAVSYNLRGGLSYRIEFEYEDIIERCYYSAGRKQMKDFYRDWLTRLTSMEEKPMRPKLRIKNVIFNDPATIVFWYDGTKTVVKCQEGDTFDPEKGLAMAICKKILGSNDSQSNFNDIFKKWLPKEEEKKEPKVIGKIKNMRMAEAGFVVNAEITDAEFAPRINEILGILGE